MSQTPMDGLALDLMDLDGAQVGRDDGALVATRAIGDDVTSVEDVLDAVAEYPAAEVANVSVDIPEGEVRVHVATGPDVATDGGHPISRKRFSADCRCGRTVSRPIRVRGEALTGADAEWVRCRVCGHINWATVDSPDEGRAIADGGLPDTFAQLADPAEAQCQSCGDRVAVDWLVGGECPGCRHGGWTDPKRKVLPDGGDRVAVSRETARTALLEVEVACRRTGGSDLAPDAAATPLAEVRRQLLDAPAEDLDMRATHYVVATIDGVVQAFEMADAMGDADAETLRAARDELRDALDHANPGGCR